LEQLFRIVRLLPFHGQRRERRKVGCVIEMLGSVERLARLERAGVILLRLLPLPLPFVQAAHLAQYQGGVLVRLAITGESEVHPALVRRRGVVVLVRRLELVAAVVSSDDVALRLCEGRSGEDREEE